MMCLLLARARVSVMQVSHPSLTSFFGRPPGTTIVLVVTPLVAIVKDQVLGDVCEIDLVCAHP